MTPKSQLPRLPAEWYRGEACVFWTFTVEKRQTGWLDGAFHAAFREILLHACVRYRLAVPVYCLMPDHLHWIGIGISPRSNQMLATRFLRQYLGHFLHPAKWQRQPHDHVLREEEREREAFLSTCYYICQNPLRAGLVENPSDWAYTGAMVPGYPRLSPFSEGFWSSFWKALPALREEWKERDPPLASS